MQRILIYEINEDLKFVGDRMVLRYLVSYIEKSHPKFMS